MSFGGSRINGLSHGRRHGVGAMAISLVCIAAGSFLHHYIIYQMKKGFIAYKKVIASAALALLMPHGASAGHDIAAGDWQVVLTRRRIP